MFREKGFRSLMFRRSIATFTTLLVLNKKHFSLPFHLLRKQLCAPAASASRLCPRPSILHAASRAIEIPTPPTVVCCVLANALEAKDMSTSLACNHTASTTYYKAPTSSARLVGTAIGSRPRRCVDSSPTQQLRSSLQARWLPFSPLPVATPPSRCSQSRSAFVRLWSTAS
jgi:hypothetical protein